MATFKVKGYETEKKHLKFTYILLKLGKCGDKHAISIDQKMSANNENLLTRLLL